MPRRCALRAPAHPVPLALLAAAALTLPLVAAAPAGAATASPAGRVLSAFPTDALTVSDERQLTGLRVVLARPD